MGGYLFLVCLYVYNGVVNLNIYFSYIIRFCPLIKVFIENIVFNIVRDRDGLIKDFHPEIKPLIQKLDNSD